MVFLKSPSDYQVENATWRLRLVPTVEKGRQTPVEPLWLCKQDLVRE